ncbi:MAG: cytochrome c oxidase accessory protein CcoG [Alcanivoracaceae bacterium]|nr:cytochrome c oxidase accessory protein CcoG [Alcanivoracaceae bacterium]
MNDSQRIQAVDVTPRDDDSVEISLYEKRERIHPKSIHGRFEQIRNMTVWTTMGIYLLGPWLRWDDRQAILFDLPARQFHIFGFSFWPQDFVFLSWLLILGAFSLFFFTVLAGRVYCGYVCPQTTWTRFFTKIEEWLEGDRNARLKLDAAPWSPTKLFRRGSKHVLWLALAFATGLTFVGYFSPITELTVRVFSFDLGFWEFFWIAFFTGATYMNAGWMREQVCKYMCPYARFQSVMFDRDTLIVSYDERRGEPRTRGAKSRDQDAAGDCIDCGLCVQVCPTGIDIRDGLQYECITCAACIDACDLVMDKINRPRGLIRYTTEHALEGGKTHVFRPRMIGYGVMLALMGVVFMVALASRVPADLDVIRDRTKLYRTASNGHIQNSYRLELHNMSQQAQTYQLGFRGPEGLVWSGPEEVTMNAGETQTVGVTLGFDPFLQVVETQPVWFTLQSRTDESIRTEHESRFIAPAQ